MSTMKAAVIAMVTSPSGAMQLQVHVQSEKHMETQSKGTSYGDSACPCIGIAGGKGTVNASIGGSLVEYRLDVGSRCEAWDNGRYPSKCESGGEPGKGHGFCAQKWCYVDPCNCEGGLPQKASYNAGATFKGKALYYSYDTCGSEDTYTAALAAESHRSPKKSKTQQKHTAKKHEEHSNQPTTDKKPDESRVQDRQKEDEQSSQKNAEAVDKVKASEESSREPDTEEPVQSNEQHGEQQGHEDDKEQADPSQDKPQKQHQAKHAAEGDKQWKADKASKAGQQEEHKQKQQHKQHKPQHDAGVTKDSNPATPSASESSSSTERSKKSSSDEVDHSAHKQQKKSQDHVKHKSSNAATVSKAPAWKTASKANVGFDAPVASPKHSGDSWAGAEQKHDTQSQAEMKDNTDEHAAASNEHVSEEKSAKRQSVESSAEAKTDGTGEEVASAVADEQSDSEMSEDDEGSEEGVVEKAKKILGIHGSEDEKNDEDPSAKDTVQEAVEIDTQDTEIEMQAMCASPVDEKVVGKSGCECVGISDRPGFLQVELGDSSVAFPADVGGSCAAWDKGTHPECVPTDDGAVPDWCQESWCYVDPCSCNQKSVLSGKKHGYISKGNFQGRRLYYSYKACGSVDLWTSKNNEEACMNKQESDCSGDCAWTGSKCSDQVLASVCDAQQSNAMQLCSKVGLVLGAISAVMAAM